MKSRIWITWEAHRRSESLAKEFDCDYYCLTSKQSRLFRYIVLTFRTLKILVRRRPEVVFCQNPSIFLAALCGSFKKLLGYRLIVDRHSNFRLETVDSRSLKWRLFHWVSNFSIRSADLVIVTNRPLQKLCERKGGQALILPDRIPSFGVNSSLITKQARPSKLVFCVTTFESDEPLDEMINACAMLGNVEFAFSGKWQKRYSLAEKETIEAKGVKFLGFVDNSVYEQTLLSSDAVLVLTTKDLILNCGAYEALGALKPLVVSDTNTIREYFVGNTIFHANPSSASSIADCVREALALPPEIRTEEAKATCRRLDLDWQESKSTIDQTVEGMASAQR